MIESRHLLKPMHNGQTSPFALMLSSLPSLCVLRTPLPAAWDASLLVASQNRCLERILLTRPLVFFGVYGFAGTGVEVLVAELLAHLDEHPWVVEAQKHSRLLRLIAACVT